ncbi:hypothetical protein DOM22_06110 [Bdellovibrio sp. ZAP7]|uniref:hypothetical protein n=1 Tax=Bdellovibrio sp. ZAP7 TaxID=2231053 RepID=UPI001157853B|nr:hypothetical protein [Bdellovibrio sp. ZAP7]QDK44768.1 hypothetical protein DOM22_06110 [Bdellovibrio sp. ZAP7]
MKFATFILIIAATANAQATDWGSLGKWAPSLKSESIYLDPDTGLRAEVYKLPTGASRFHRLFVKNTPIKVIVDAKRNSKAGDLCKLSIFLGKRFKAKLVIPGDGISAAALAKFSTFENSVVVGEPKINLTKNYGYWISNDTEYRESKGSLENEISLIGAKVRESDGREIQIDLSDKNALACDLMEQTVQFSVVRDITYEKALPDKTMWIKQSAYTSIYQQFWKFQPNVVSNKNTPKQNEIAEAFALGVAARSVVATSEMLNSAERIQTFLNSVKADYVTLNATQKATAKDSELYNNWGMNIDYVKPENPKYTLNCVIGETLDVNIGD